MATFGQLRIVPSADIGDLGPAEGAATPFQWHWYYSVPGLLLWIVLILAIAAPRFNRDRRILLILAPLLVVGLLWLLLKRALNAPSGPAEQLDVPFYPLAVGIPILWLIAPALAQWWGKARFLLSALVLAALGVLGIRSYGTGASGETVPFLVLVITFGLVLLFALAAAARQCRQNWRPARLLLLLAFWMAVGGIAGMYLCGVIMFTVESSGLSLSDLPAAAFYLALGGLILGLCLYVMNLPYMILGFTSPFFRQRMQSCLNLKATEDILNASAPQDQDAAAPPTPPESE